MLKLCKITAYLNGTLGLHLSRAPWDPYPWISGVQDGSNAYQAGVRTGDAVLELNGCDILGQKISELAVKIQNHLQGGISYVTMLIWRNKTENTAVNQNSLQKFAKCLQNVAQLLECPICLEIVKPPGWQCCNGHVLCNSCRGRTVKCPICRVTLGPRGRCLLSDKLFILLAESFPCDGVKSGNSLSRNYRNDCHETPLIKTKIGNSPSSSPSCSSTKSCSSSSSSSSTLEKVYQRKQLTENTILNHLKKLNNNDNDINKLATDSKSTTTTTTTDDNEEDDDDYDDDYDDVNIVVLKLNQKSKKKNDFLDDQQYDSTCNLSSQHHRRKYQQQNQHHHHHHQQHHYQNLPQSLGQQELTFHCPTGKSSCSSIRPEPEFDPDSKVKTLDCMWTQDFLPCRRRKLKGESKFDTCGKFITKWDILSHLTQVHQIFVAQHYTDYGRPVRLQFLQNFKSIPCITIQSKRNCTPDRDKENLKTSFMSTGLGRGNIQENRQKITFHTKTAVQQTGTELFFVACVPLDDVQNDDDEATKTDGNSKEEEILNRHSMNDVHADTKGDTPPPTYEVIRNTSAGPPTVVVVSPPQELCTGVIKIETKSKSTRKVTHSQTTGHLIQDPGSEECTTSLQSQWVKQQPQTNSHAHSTGYRNSSLRVDPCTWCSFQSSSFSSSTSSSSSSSSSSSLASYSMSSTRSSHCCCSSPSDITEVSRQHAIFIWYFGNESDVKNFQTVIECKRSGLKWTGCVHPLTKSWSSLQRQQQRHMMEQQFFVLNSMPDGGDNFFDIVIKMK